MPSGNRIGYREYAGTVMAKKSTTKRVNGRKKGASFERKIAAEVSDWIGAKCTRTPSSGGWAKTGDITPKDPKDMVKFRFNMELKKREGWNFTQLFNLPLEGQFKSWWEQCVNDAKKSKRTPLLIFSKNHERVFCMMRQDDFRKLGLNRSVAYLRIGGLRVCLWQDLLQIPYSTVLGRMK